MEKRVLRLVRSEARIFLRLMVATEKIADCTWRGMMKSIHTARATIAIVLGLGSSIFMLHAQNQPSEGKTEAASRQEAKSTFESVCAACHGLDGRGGERGPDVASGSEAVRKSDAELLSVVRDGRPSKGMPAFSTYEESKLLALVAYLRELQGAGRRTSSTGDPARGRELFFGKAKCSDCHAVGGQGGFFGSDLSGFAAKKTADELRTAIVAPNKDRDPRKGPVTVKLSDSTVLTGMPRNEDNFSLQLQTLDGQFHFLDKSKIMTIARTPNSLMPTDYGRTLSPTDLADLVTFLANSAGSRGARQASQSGDDEEDQ